MVKKKKSKDDGITENHQDGSWEASQEIHERKKKEAEAQDGIWEPIHTYKLHSANLHPTQCSWPVDRTMSGNYTFKWTST